MTRDSAIDKELDGDDTPPLFEDLWDVHKVAEAIGFKQVTIYKLVHDGTLPAYRVGGTRGRDFRFRRSDVEALLVPVTPKAER